MKRAKRLACLIACACLAACGGSGDESTAITKIKGELKLGMTQVDALKKEPTMAYLDNIDGYAYYVEAVPLPLDSTGDVSQSYEATRYTVFDSGAKVCCIALLYMPNKLLESQDYGVLREHFTSYLPAIQEVYGEPGEGYEEAKSYIWDVEDGKVDGSFFYQYPLNDSLMSFKQAYMMAVLIDDKDLDTVGPMIGITQ